MKKVIFGLFAGCQKNDKKTIKKILNFLKQLVAFFFLVKNFRFGLLKGIYPDT